MRIKSHRIRRLCVATCAAPLLVYTGATAATAAAVAAPVGTQSSVRSAVQQASANDIFALVNEEHEKAGCPALKENAKLTEAAKIHAEDMSKNNLTSHDGSDGSDVPDRLQRVGYSYSAWGENVSGPGYDTAADHVRGWMNSDPHRRTIQSCEFTETGVAVSGDRAVQVFAKPS
ncbi:CAP domain-containing protein [Streptomyces sp. NPDC002004]